MSYFPIDVLSIIISFTKLNNSNVSILCLVNIWFSKNVKLIRFKNFCLIYYPNIKVEDIKILIKLLIKLISLDFGENKCITDYGLVKMLNL